MAWKIDLVEPEEGVGLAELERGGAAALLEPQRRADRDIATPGAVVVAGFVEAAIGLQAAVDRGRGIA